MDSHYLTVMRTEGAVLMFKLDPSNAFQARVADRLTKEIVGWLTTVGADGIPQPSLVWFLWDGGDKIQIYSQDNQKVRNVNRNAGVSFNFDGDGKGGDMIVLTGTAVIDSSSPSAAENAPYVEKYASGIKSVSGDPTGFAAAYRIPIVMTITRLRGH
jgi:PPOX class probable F420-dependent enzyme